MPAFKLRRLKKLNEIRRLARLGVPNIRLSYDAPDLLAGLPPPKLNLPVVFPPFRSVEEVLIWEQIQEFDLYWEPMVPLFGGPGVEGGTEIDFYNGKLQIALYADGPPHLLPEIAARDHVLRKAVESAGLTVLSFQYRIPEDVIGGFATWYNEHVE